MVHEVIPLSSSLTLAFALLFWFDWNWTASSSQHQHKQLGWCASWAGPDCTGGLRRDGTEAKTQAEKAGKKKIPLPLVFPSCPLPSYCNFPLRLPLPAALPPSFPPTTPQPNPSFPSVTLTFGGTCALYPPKVPWEVPIRNTYLGQVHSRSVSDLSNSSLHVTFHPSFLIF